MNKYDERDRDVAFIGIVHEILDTTTMTIVRGGVIFEASIINTQELAPVVGDVVILEKIPASVQYYLFGIL